MTGRASDAEEPFTSELVEPAGLADNDAHDRRVIESLRDGVIVQSADGQIRSANPEAARILGLPVHELIGQRWSDLPWRAVDDGDHPLPAESHPAMVALRTGEPVIDFTTGVHTTAGRLRWLTVSAFPLRNPPDTSPYAVVLSFRDITQERAATQQAHFRATLLNAAGQAIIATDVSGTITYWNPAAERMYGWPARDVLGRNVLDVLPSPEMTEQAERIFAELAAGRSWAGDFVVRRRDGTSFSAFVSDTPVFDEDGQLTGVVGVSTDVTGRIRAETALRGLSAIIDSSGDAIVGETLDGTIVSWNRGAENLYGFGAKEVIGLNAGMFAPETSAAELTEILRRVGLGETVKRLETTRLRKGGGLIDISLTMSPTYDDDGTVIGCSAIARDITVRAVAQRALLHQAVHDTLTGLPNRVLLADRLTQALARAGRRGERVAVMFLDLDGFKLVNDGLGHLAGDELLVDVARRLQGCMRSDDTVARFGGDEFVILSEVAGTEAAKRFGNRLLEALRLPFTLRGKDMFVTASIGLVVADRDADPDKLLQNADAAMYRAKERGRSRMELFDDTLGDRAALTLESSNELRRALERGELRVFYQPIVDAVGNQPVAVEALLRWQHPERGLVSPDEFIPLIEDLGMIVPIGSWVLQEALRERAVLQAQLPEQTPLRLAVNLSARQLSEPGLVDEIAAMLLADDTDPGSLILEVTESVLMHDASALSTLNSIHDLGIALHVDDFGTGYSSFAYLKTLPVDALKIDRAFVNGLGSDADDQAIVTAMLALARALQLDVVAEGVETPQQLRTLQELGCDFLQGFLFSRPLPYDELVAWLRDAASHQAESPLIQPTGDS